VDSQLTTRASDARGADRLSAPLTAGTEPRDEPVLLSLVIPVYNEEATLDALFSGVRDRLATLGISYEVVLIDDGSRDRTAEMIVEMTRRDARFRSVHFSRNFGHQAAVTAGLHFARGSAVVVMDADLQDPPELLPAMPTAGARAITSSTHSA
jgi:dolichol-phosphate mannosyltransferase